MSDDDNAPPEPKEEVGGELIIPAAALAFTLYYFSTILDSPWTAQVNAFMVGTFLIAAILVFVVLKLRLVVAGKATMGASNILAPRHILKKRTAYVGLCLFYLLAIEWVGFTLTTFLFLWSAMVLLNDGNRIGFSVVMATIMAMVGYAVFIALFETRLPHGLIEKSLAGLL